MLAVDKIGKCRYPNIADLRRKRSPQGPGARASHSSQNHTHILGSARPVSGAGPRGGGSWSGCPAWRFSPCPRLRVPSQALPGAQVGRDGEDAGQSRDDTAHVGDEGQVLPVHGIHLHGGHLGPRDGLGLASVSPLNTEGSPRRGSGRASGAQHPPPRAEQTVVPAVRLPGRRSVAVPPLSGGSLTHTGPGPSLGNPSSVLH